MKISDFRILSGWIEKYEPALSKSDSSWDNSYYMRLVIVSLAVDNNFVSWFLINSKKFSYKDPIPNDLKSFLVYTFTCASCSSSYIGETCHYFKTGIEEHIKKDSKCHICKHLHSSAVCFDSYTSLCFKIIDNTNSKFDLKTKEALHINWRKPNLNAQQNHLTLTLSL